MKIVNKTIQPDRNLQLTKKKLCMLGLIVNTFGLSSKFVKFCKIALVWPGLYRPT